MTRKGDTGYENDPVSSLTSKDMVCRHGTRNSGVPLKAVSAGGSMTLKWDFGAAHVGDCAVFISYDLSADRNDQRFFKIANLPKCKDQNKNEVTITLPDFLPPGEAVLRWDWSALHTWPNVEFYSQCIDLQITGSANSVQVGDFNAYSIVDPPIYPLSGRDGVGFRNPFQPGSEQYMTGTACARGFTGNNCDLTALGTRGNTGGGGEAPGSGGGGGGNGVDNGSDGSETDQTPICEVYTVKSGDTLSSIADYYTNKGISVTWQQICSFNGISGNCDNIDVGDTYTIPNTCKTNPDSDESGWGGGGILIFSFLIVGVGALGIYFSKFNTPIKRNEILRSKGKRKEIEINNSMV